MSTQVDRLPAPRAVRETLAALLGRSVELEAVAPTRAADLAGPSRMRCAMYVSGAGVCVAYVVIDLDFAARAGAALGLVPAADADAAREAGALGQQLEDNVHEVLNVCSVMFPTAEVGGVRLRSVLAGGLAEQVVKSAVCFGGRLDLEIVIGGYGPGRMSVLALS